MNRRQMMVASLGSALVAGAAPAAGRKAEGAFAGGPGPRLFPNDNTFWFELQRSFANAEYGGSLFGEVLAIAAQIREGDFESWYVAFNSAADRIAAEGRDQLRRGHRISARDSFMRASSYYYSSEFFLHGTPGDPRISRAYRNSIGCYKQACALFETPIEPVDIPYEGKRLPGYFHQPDGPHQKRPTLLIHTGFDGSAEEMHMTGARAAVERGYNVVAFDGPGQYGALHRDGLVFRPDWEKVIGPVIDFALKRAVVDPERIVLMGMSLGGLLAPRAAAFEPRLAAVVANDGVFDFGAVMVKLFAGGQASALQPSAHAEEQTALDQKLAALLASKSTARWFLHHGMWATGSATPREYLRKTLDYNLRGGIAEKITCPLLVCAAEGDAAIGGQAEELYARASSKTKKLLRFAYAEGAGAHCQVGASRLAFARIFDWLDELLAR